MIEEVVGELLQREIRDPRVAGLTSVTRVEVTPDVRFAKIYVSVMGSEEERLATIRALEHATGFVRSKLGEELTIRHVPAVTFQLDRSLEQGDRVLALINQVALATKALDAQAAAASSPASSGASGAPLATAEPSPSARTTQDADTAADTDADASDAPASTRRTPRPLKLRRSPRSAE